MENHLDYNKIYEFLLCHFFYIYETKIELLKKGINVEKLNSLGGNIAQPTKKNYNSKRLIRIKPKIS